ncbi:MAG: alanine racemase [Endozoicomonas sp.]
MSILFLVAIVLVVVLVLFRSRDNGQPHNDYFSSIQKNLKQCAPGRPVMLVDMDRVDANIERVRERVGDTSKIRLVAKSLPCMELLKYLQNALGSNRLMVFHQPFLSQLFREFIDNDFLIGKPFPVQAVKTFLDNLGGTDQKRLHQIQWLVDSHARLTQYLSLAKEKRIKLRINIEIDVGLHRGGVQSADEVRRLLQLIKSHPDSLIFSGFMGYEPHLAKASLARLQRSGKQHVLKTYSGFVEIVRNEFPDLFHDDLYFNSAGSMTYQLYPETDRGVINELSIGSAFVKPVDFDLSTLKDHQPAFFIATPVLKMHRGLLLPFADDFLRPFTDLNTNLQQSYFIYGGWWKATSCSPAGLSNNRLYGRSTNQELMTGSCKTGLEVDDYIFLRPNQSESVMLQFGQLYSMRDLKLAGRLSAFVQNY